VPPGDEVQVKHPVEPPEPVAVHAVHTPPITSHPV